MTETAWIAKAVSQHDRNGTAAWGVGEQPQRSTMLGIQTGGNFPLLS
jgi:hypothetical protein